MPPVFKVFDPSWPPQTSMRSRLLTVIFLSQTVLFPDPIAATMGSVEVHFTRHARNRMRLYRLDEEVVIMTVAQPDAQFPGAHGRKHVWRSTPDGRWLRVTVREEQDRQVVITVTPKARPPGEPHAD